MIEFDAKKERINKCKHGCSLALASELFEGIHFSENFDDDPTHGEDRWIATGLIAERIFVCVYTMRGKVRRIISLRRATRSEAKDYLRNR